MPKLNQTTTKASSVSDATSARLITIMQSLIIHGIQKLR